MQLFTLCCALVVATVCSGVNAFADFTGWVLVRTTLTIDQRAVSTPARAHRTVYLARSCRECTCTERWVCAEEFRMIRMMSGIMIALKLHCIQTMSSFDQSLITFKIIRYQA